MHSQNSGKRKRSKVEEEWLASLPESERAAIPPAELRPERASSLDEAVGDGGMVRHEVTAQREPVPAAPRVNKGDAPPDYDPVLGLVVEWDAEPRAELDDDDEKRRLVGMATDLVQRLGPVSAYPAGVLPLARVDIPEDVSGVHIDDRLRDAIPALEALHRALFPGWRAIVRNWLESHARAKIEAKYRVAWKDVDLVPGVGDGTQKTLTGQMPRTRPPNGADILATIRRNPPELMGNIPEGLSPEMLDYLAGVVTRTGKGAGGYTPAKAIEKLEEWTAKPEKFRDDASIDARKKHTRRRRRRLQE